MSNVTGATINISIHALREESDRSPTTWASLPVYFNPRPPRGERLTDAVANAVAAIFQSTPSARRATVFIPKFSPA